MVPLVYYAYYFISDKLHNLNNLTSEDVFALLDEIPSDGSVISESSDEEFIAEVVSGGLMKVEEENSEWEDDDLLPLINFVHIPEEQTKWSRHAVTNTIEEFRERTGPNISEEFDTPYLLVVS